MTNEALQTLSQLLVAVGVVMTAIGGFGAYHFGQRIEREKEQKVAAAEKMRAAHVAQSGAIRPALPVLDANDRLFPAIELGQSGAILVYAGPEGKPLFDFIGENSISIVKEGGYVKLSALIRDPSGAVVAEMIRNEWRVNPARAWDRNYSADAVEVRDASGDVVLQVRSLADRVQFQAKLYDQNGRGLAFGNAPGRPGGAIEMTGPSHTKLDMKIESLFRYPSDRHLGEFAADKRGA